MEAAEEAVRLYRALAKARPDAFTPDLAMSLNNLASFLSDLGRREAALEVAEEAVRLLSGPFLAMPAAHARHMVVMSAAYREMCEGAGAETDGQLLEPIEKVLRQLSEESEG